MWKDNPIIPTRALYICDGNCTPTCGGCFCVKEVPEVNYTTDVVHAKNGPVVNVREWETRFELKEHGNLLYYQEKTNGRFEN